MIDLDNIRKVVVKGLSDYLKIPVIRSNQTGPAPKYPYLSYTIMSLAAVNKGTWGVYDDGIDRKPKTQTWSFTIQSDNASEAMEITVKAYEWLEHVGRLYLTDNNIIVQSLSNISNRDNLITIEYEYRHGFDVIFWFLSEIDTTNDSGGTIEQVTIDGEEIKPIDYNDMLEKRLSGEEVSE